MPPHTNHSTELKETGNPVQVQSKDLKIGAGKESKKHEVLRRKTAHIGRAAHDPKFRGVGKKVPASKTELRA